MENEWVREQRARLIGQIEDLEAENARLKTIVEAESIRADNWTKESKQLQAEKAELVEALSEVIEDLDDVCAYDGGISRDTRDKIESLLTKVKK